MYHFVGLNLLKLLTDKGISHPPPPVSYLSKALLQLCNILTKTDHFSGAFLVGRQSQTQKGSLESNDEQY